MLLSMSKMFSIHGEQRTFEGQQASAYGIRDSPKASKQISHSDIVPSRIGMLLDKTRHLVIRMLLFFLLSRAFTFTLHVVCSERGSESRATASHPLISGCPCILICKAEGMISDSERGWNTSSSKKLPKHSQLIGSDAATSVLDFSLLQHRESLKMRIYCMSHVSQCPLLRYCATQLVPSRGGPSLTYPKHGGRYDFAGGGD
jgi:hypothetical protein